MDDVVGECVPALKLWVLTVSMVSLESTWNTSNTNSSVKVFPVIVFTQIFMSPHTVILMSSILHHPNITFEHKD